MLGAGWADVLWPIYTPRNPLRITALLLRDPWGGGECLVLMNTGNVNCALNILAWRYSLLTALCELSEGIRLLTEL